MKKLIAGFALALFSLNLFAASPTLAGTNVYTGSNSFVGPLVAGNLGNQVSGTFTGNGSGLTINGANVTNLYAGNFNGDLIYDAPPGAIWWAMKKPVLMFYIAAYERHIPGLPDDTETTTVNKLNWLLTYLPAITNAGWEVAFNFDIGWDGRRNFNPAFVMTNCGSYYWDTNFFPHGMPWLIRKLATNGVETILHAYAYTNEIPIGASGLSCSDNGTPAFIPYTNGVGSGFIYSNASGFKYTEMITPSTIASDIAEFRWWGARGFIMNDTFHSDSGMVTIEKMAASACLNFTAPRGFNQDHGNSYWNQLQAYDWSSTNGWTQYGSAAVFNPIYEQNYFTNLVAFLSLPYERRDDDTRVYGQYTAAYKNGPFYENFGTPNTIRNYIQKYLIDCGGAVKVSQGAYAVSPALNNGAIGSLVPWIGSFCIEVDTYSTNSMLIMMKAATNSALTAIANDADQQFAALALDTGGGYYSALKKKLANGDVALMLQNDTVNQTNITVNFSSISNMPSGNWFATTVYTETGFIVSQNGASVTVQLNNNSDAIMLRLSPQTSAANTNATVLLINVHALGVDHALSQSSGDGFLDAPVFGFNDTTIYHGQVEVPNWITNAVSVLKFHFNNGGQFTNQYYSKYWTSDGGASATAQINDVVRSGTAANAQVQATYTFTNSWPDTNCIKAIIFNGIGASNNSYAFLIGWSVTATGVNRGTNY